MREEHHQAEGDARVVTALLIFRVNAIFERYDFVEDMAL